MTERNKKIKVLYISHSSDLFGAEQSLLSLLQYLNRDRYEPLVVFPTKGELVNKVNALGIQTVIVPSLWWIGNKSYPRLILNLLTELISAVLIVRLIRKYRIDIVHTNSIVKINGALAAKVCRVPHIWHIREILKGSPLRSVLGLRNLFGIVHRLSSKVIGNSNAVKNQISEEWRDKKVIVIYNGIDPVLYSKQDEGMKLKKELLIDHRYRLIGVIGNISPHKGQQDVIEAYVKIKEKMDKVKLLMIGKGKRSYVNDLKKLVKKNHIDDSVIFTGFRTDIPEILQEIDLVVTASWTESFGRVTLEAMATGKPVVATNTGASPEIVIDGETGTLVPARNPERLAEAMIDLLSDSEKAKQMGRKGRERVKERFTVQKYIENIECLYEEVMREANARGALPDAGP